MWFERRRGSVGMTRLAREAATYWSLTRQRHSALRAVNTPQYPPYSTATDPEPMNSVLLVLSCRYEWGRGRMRAWKLS
jgi:hypothetical protein